MYYVTRVIKMGIASTAATSLIETIPIAEIFLQRFSQCTKLSRRVSLSEPGCPTEVPVSALVKAVPLRVIGRKVNH